MRAGGGYDERARAATASSSRPACGRLPEPRQQARGVGPVERVEARVRALRALQRGAPPPCARRRRPRWRRGGRRAAGRRSRPCSRPGPRAARPAVARPEERPAERVVGVHRRALLHGDAAERGRPRPGRRGRRRTAPARGRRCRRRSGTGPARRRRGRSCRSPRPSRRARSGRRRARPGSRPAAGARRPACTSARPWRGRRGRRRRRRGRPRRERSWERGERVLYSASASSRRPRLISSAACWTRVHCVPSGAPAPPAPRRPSVGRAGQVALQLQGVRLAGVGDEDGRCSPSSSMVANACGYLPSSICASPTIAFAAGENRR